QDADGSGRRARERGVAPLARSARADCVARGACVVRRCPRKAHRAAGGQYATQGTRKAARHADAGPSARAAAFIRLTRAAVLAGSARRAGDAWSFEHRDDAGLYAPRLPGARQGVRRGASAREAKMIVLKRGREKSVNRRHPWIFSGALERVEGNPKSGETVQVRSADGKPLAL